MIYSRKFSKIYLCFSYVLEIGKCAQFPIFENIIIYYRYISVKMFPI